MNDLLISFLKFSSTKNVFAFLQKNGKKKQLTKNQMQSHFNPSNKVFPEYPHLLIYFFISVFFFLIFLCLLFVKIIIDKKYILNFVSRPHFNQSINLRQQQSLPRNRDLIHFLAEWRAIVSIQKYLPLREFMNPIITSFGKRKRRKECLI